jgi:hypothetical protein
MNSHHGVFDTFFYSYKKTPSHQLGYVASERESLRKALGHFTLPRLCTAPVEAAYSGVVVPGIKAVIAETSAPGGMKKVCYGVYPSSQVVLSHADFYCAVERYMLPFCTTVETLGLFGQGEIAFAELTLDHAYPVYVVFASLFGEESQRLEAVVTRTRVEDFSSFKEVMEEKDKSASLMITESQEAALLGGLMPITARFRAAAVVVGSGKKERQSRAVA